MIKRSLSLVLIFSSVTAFSAGYYWVGGHGNWSDLSHWATTSGGADLHEALPGPEDNVYFDVNSFTDLGQEVSLDLNPIEIGNLNCTGAQFFPKITGTSEERIVISASNAGSAFSFAKNSGSVDAYYMDIRDNNAVGGAVFTAFESNLISGVSGWNDANNIYELNLTEINAWPNPFSSELTIDLKAPVGFYIVDSTGRKVIDKTLNREGQTQIDLSGLSPGLYFLKVDQLGYKGKALLKN